MITTYRELNDPGVARKRWYFRVAKQGFLWFDDSVFAQLKRQWARLDDPFAMSVFLFILALVVRLPFLGRASLWMDEVVFIQRSAPPMTPWGVLQNRWENFAQLPYMPLGGMIQNAWLWACEFIVADATHSPFCNRIPALILGCATVPLLYALARKVADRRIAVVTGLLLCLSYFPVHYSRETRFYATALFFSVWAMNTFMTVICTRRMTIARAVFLYMALTATCLTVLNGAALPIAFALVSVGLLGVCVVRKQREGRVACFWVIGVVGAVVTTVSPFLAVFLLNAGKSNIGEAMGHPFFDMGFLFGSLDDFLSSIVIGRRTVGSVVAWVLVVAGLIAVFQKNERRADRLVFLAACALFFGGLVAGILKTHYYFPRVLYMACAPAYVVLSFGLSATGKLFAAGAVRCGLSARKVGVIQHVPLTLLLITHSFLFLPLMYSCPAKHARDYQRIAEILNANLKPGTPYILEEAHEMRFIPGFFKTPGLVAATPFVGSDKPESYLRGRAVRRAFFERFPEAAYVETARQGAIAKWSALGRWQWPVTHFSQHVELCDRPLVWLSRLGMTPGRVPAIFPIIWWNSKGDLQEKARAQGLPVLASYPNPSWRVVGVGRKSPDTIAYMRFSKGKKGLVKLKNVLGRPVTGKVRLTTGVVGGVSESELVTRAGGQTCTSRIKAGHLASIEIAPIEIPTEGLDLELLVTSWRTGSGGGIVLQDLDFVASEPN